MQMTFEIPLPWDVLDIAIQECITGYANGLVDYSHVIKNPGNSVFSLSQEELGPLGDAILKKRSGKITEISWPDPPRPKEEEIDNDWKSRYKRGDVDGWLKLDEEYQARIEEIYQKRRDHLDLVLRAYLNRLVHEVSVWIANESTPPVYVLNIAGIGEESDRWLRNRTSTTAPVWNEADEEKLLKCQAITLKDLKWEDYFRWLKEFLGEKKLGLYWKLLCLPYQRSSQDPDYLLGEIGINRLSESQNNYTLYIESWSKEAGIGYVSLEVNENDGGIRASVRYSLESTWLANDIAKETAEKYSTHLKYWPDIWPAYPGNFPPFERMPSIDEVDSVVWATLMSLDPKRYDVKRERVGRDIYYYISFREGILIGRYRVRPGEPGYSIYSPDKEKYRREWENICNLTQLDLQRKFGKFPMNDKTPESSTAENQNSKPGESYTFADEAAGTAHFWITPQGQTSFDGTFNPGFQLKIERVEPIIFTKKTHTEPESIIPHRIDNISDKRGPNVRTQQRFEVFKKLKEKHPGWSQSRVALESLEELGETVTGDTVRNTYRLMGIKWKRGDRIR
jgi:hypothetical protein